MAILSSTGIAGFLSSAKATGKKVLTRVGSYIPEYVEHFVSGFGGYGWKIWEYVSGKWMLEIDALRVRGTMTVFELLISKIRAIKGSQAITQGCGKIKSVSLSDDGWEYLLTLEEEDMSFMEHDFVRCQQFSGSGQKAYHVEISSVEGGVVHIPVSHFEKDAQGRVLNPPEAGDEIVQFGNSSHDEKYAGRHSAIYMHADESGQPAIDVMFDIYSTNWEGCVKMRMGGDIPGGGGLKGFYCVNGMLKGVDAGGHTTYCLYPDGTAELGDGSALFKPDKSGHIAGGAIAWEWDGEKQKYICTLKGVTLTWDNLDDETKENLKGESGLGIEEADVEYSRSTSNSVAPATGWQTVAPPWENGKYIWSRTRITLSDGSVSYTSAACISGGKGIFSIEEEYYLSSSSLSVSGGSWSTERPEWKNGWYIWTRSVITYTDGTSTVTQAVCVSGEKGENGKDGIDGINGADGVNGKDGTSLLYRGEHASHPSGAEDGWYYRNTVDKKCYVYQDGAWYVMTVDGSDGRNGINGINGKDGVDGLSVVWKGDLSVPPSEPQKNWCYRDTDNGRVYIYNGTAWELLLADGNDGKDGTDGADGHHVYITYHDIEAEPSRPTGEGTEGGWHTDATASVVWMSQKVAENASSGSWGAPIKIKGERGQQGIQGLQGAMGEQGIPGVKGEDGSTSYFHIKYSPVENPTASQMSESPDTYIGTYVDFTQADSNDPSRYVWHRFEGLQGKTGEQGIPGGKGEDGRTSYLHIKYSNDGGKTFTDNNGETAGDYIGQYVDFTQADSNTPGDYKWSRIKGEPGDITNLPWLSEWNKNQTEIEGEYVVSPKMFSGKRDETTGKLTGIAMGRDCLTGKDGSKRTGIFALVDDEIVFELDPITKKYLFRGKVDIADGKILLDYDGSGHLCNGLFSWDVFGRRYVKSREIVVWRTVLEEMYDAGVSIYDIDLKKGTFLWTIGDWLDRDKYINLPDPNDCPNLVLDIYNPMRTRTPIPFLKIKCDAVPILQITSGSSSYSEVILEDPVKSAADGGIHKTITSELNGNSYTWIASPSFTTYPLT